MPADEITQEIPAATEEFESYDWTGILTAGQPTSLNNAPFSLDGISLERGIGWKAHLAIGDVIGYPSGRKYLIIEVESDLVRMSGPL